MIEECTLRNSAALRSEDEPRPPSHGFEVMSVEEAGHARASAKVLGTALPGGPVGFWWDNCRTASSREAESRLSLREVAGEGGRLLLQLLLQVAVCLIALIPQLGRCLLEHFSQCLQFCGQAADCIGPLLFLGLQLSCHGLDFVAYVRRLVRQTALQVMAQLGRLCKQLGLEFGKPALVITDLGAEENIAGSCRGCCRPHGLRPARGRFASVSVSGVRSERRVRSRSVCLLMGRLLGRCCPVTKACQGSILP